jgi:hypothetical protein
MIFMRDIEEGVVKNIMEAVDIGDAEVAVFG